MDSLLPGRSTIVSIQAPRPEGEASPCLIVISGPGLGQHIQLDTHEVDIGRSDQCALCIDSEKISRRHANVVRVAGEFVVLDLNSTNGTFVNDERIQMATLKDGDQIRVGRTVLKYTESSVELEYFEHVLNLATRDALTGAHNKRRFDELLAQEVKRASASPTLCLLLFDIDFFKRINDEHGHPAGDEVLRNVSRLARAIVESSGELCRVGGEEFAVVLPECEIEQAFTLAEKLRSAIAQHSFDVEGKHLPMTISLGIASFQPGDDENTLYKRADERLYDSKRGGRNRVSR